MSLRPEIFLSAAAPEFNALRKVVKHALLEIGARPVEQADFSYEYGPLHGVLTQLMEKCGAVIHLLGHQYGPEPDERTLHAPRRSFTIYEMDMAQKLGLPIYTFAPEPSCPVLAYGQDDVEAQQLQAEHRQDFLQGERAAQTFASPDDLARLIRGLRSKLVVRRSLVRLPGRPLAERFIGRKRTLEELRNALTPGSLHLLQPGQALRVHGGAGASAVALELAWRLHDERRLDFVFWLPAGGRTDFEAALASLARTDSLSLVPDAVASHRARLQAVRDWFADPVHEGKFLVIVDGLEGEAAWWGVRPYLDLFRGGATILTGHAPAAAGLLVHTIAPFSLEQAQEFILSRLRLAPAMVAAETSALQRLADGLGRIPLALELLAGHLAESKLTPRAFLQSLGAGIFDLALVFERSVAALDETARGLLRQLACLAPEPAAIPLAIFEHRGDWPLTSAALGTLEQRGLIHRDESTHSLRFHRAVRELTRDRLLLGEHAAEALGAVRPALETALQRADAGGESAHPGLREMLIPHCRALLGQLNGHPLEIHAANLARGLAEWLTDCGRPAEAEVFSRRALAIEERRLGPDDPALAPRLRELASLLRTQRQLVEAEALLRRALALSEEHAGVESAEAAADWHLLAECLRAADRLTEAEKVARRAWALDRRLSGPVHPKVANAMHRVAGILEAARRPREAESLYRQALAIDEAAFGPSHPRLASRHYHLGRLLGEVGRPEEGLELFARGLASEEQKLGRDHVELGPVLAVQAELLEAAGRLREAEQAYRDALRIYERFLGAQHPETVLAQGALGSFLLDAGRAAEALPILNAALTACQWQRGRWRGAPPHLRTILAVTTAAWRAQGLSAAEIEAAQRAFDPPRPRRKRSRFLEGEPAPATA